MCDQRPDLPGEDGGPEQGDPRGLGPAVPFFDAFQGSQNLKKSGEAGQDEEGVALEQQH